MSNTAPARGRHRSRLVGFVVVLITAIAVVLAGCSSGSAVTEDGKVVLRYQGTPSQVRWYELASALGYFEKLSLKWVGDTTSGPQDIQSVATGEIEIGGAFNGSVAKLQQAGAPIESVVSDVGSDGKTFNGYYSLEGSGIVTARDLIGKKVGINTLGAYHEFAINEWLHRQGLTDKEIESVQLTVVPPLNTEQALRSKQIDVGNLGTIFKDVALKSGNLHEIFRDTDLIGALSISTTVLRRDFIEKNQDAVRDFVQGYARAIRWAQLHTREEVVDKFVQIIDKRGRNENTNFVKQWKSAGVPTPGGVIDKKEFQVWIDEAERLGELKPGVDASTLFTNEYNPYSNGTYAPDADENGRGGTKAGA
ncbi:ABC transporter substrate-binding protein [Gordonia soli]|uniref:Putative ABC transporter substrate-binding protein n=1 Tax=Gordonia soli NBRC 108243 TaxID=1223545 RepID=M0QRU5_9ACTN|nr:ABC transporter substrate-binding protein [Gordonia soli]GAC70387.1 putative ABC transporter substrate-binding protein [Gordonia soli NBRC 108243]